MNRFLDTLFFIVFSIYNRWKDFDAFYHSAFVVGVLFSSSVNFLFELLFLTTNNEIFKFKLFPVGIVLIMIIACFVYYFYSRKNILITFYSKNKDQLNRSYMIYYIVLALMFSTWFITLFLFKFRN